MKQGSEKKFPVDANDYELYEEIGDGLSATVYRALCRPHNETVAVKVLDLEKCKNDLDCIRGEVQTLSLTNDPNLLRAHCSFITGHNLWIVMPYMAGGSCLHIMKSAYPDGFEEAVIATLLREILKALVYLHGQGFIHRDVKAGNILIDSNGTVKLADFGVSACIFDTGNRQRSRTTFVGTPCWMAPEVMNQVDGFGYDFKADIWSFGITALELAHGHAPFSKYPPMKVLMMTIHNAPPGLDYERDKRFSKSFKQLVSACLVKDPKKRPSSEKLLKHPFFKHARSPDYLSRTILHGVPPLADRYRMLKAKEAELLVKNKALQSDKNEQSQQQYARGISAWNFDLEDLKNQAALIEEPDLISNPDSLSSSDASPPDEKLSSERLHNLDVSHLEDGINLIQSLEDSPSSFPIKPLEELKSCFDVCEDHLAVSSPSPKYSVRQDSEQQSQIQLPGQNSEEREVGRYEGQSTSPVSSPLPKSPLARPFSSSPQQDSFPSPKKVASDGDRSCANMRHQFERNYTGAIRKQDNIHEGGIVQCKGRFKVTSADIAPSGPTNGFGSAYGSSTSSSPPTPTFSNFVEREEFLKLIKYLVRKFGNSTELSDTGIDDLLHIPIASPREKELQSQVNQLEQSAENMAEELQKQKAKVAQLEEKLEAMEKNISKR